MILKEHESNTTLLTVYLEATTELESQQPSITLLAALQSLISEAMQ